MGWKTGTMFAAASVAALMQGAAAQQPPQALPATEAKAESEGVKKFEPAFFARYSPVTAFDMVRQLPGFSINNGDSLRGFGATAGNVLIDGQRPSSKNAISDELQRIAARDVARIDLIAAAAAGDVDVRGYTELANVVLKPAGAMQTSSTWRGDLIWQGERLSVRVGDTASWKTKDLGVRLNVQAIDQGRLLRRQCGDHALEVLPEVVTELRRILPVLLEDLIVDRPLVLKVPREELVHEEAANDDASLLSEDADRTFEVLGPRRGRGFEHA